MDLGGQTSFVVGNMFDFFKYQVTSQSMNLLAYILTYIINYLITP